MADIDNYGPLTALDGTDLQLQQGEGLALPGSSGAGEINAIGLLPG